MQPGRNTQLVDDLRQIFGPGRVAPEDRVLLESFVADRDEAAFEALVSRHGPMVRGVCRRLLRDSHDADDAFQATFLVLMLKSRRIRHADRLAPWLYGVATRVATKARVQAARRRDRHEGEVETLGAPDPPHDLGDVRALLDAEIGRLPGKLRQAVILCLAEGATAEEAARRLGCPVGTVKSRLARGRATLQINLTKRGIAPSVALATGSSLAPAPVSATLLRSTVATALASTIAPAVLTLTRGVAPTMIAKPTALAALLLGGIVLTGGFSLARWQEVPAPVQQPVATPPRQTLTERVSRDHLKQTMIAIHNYHAVNDEIPPWAIFGTDGQPKLSWRVALLPYVGEAVLFREFHLDEPWDSPHNKALIPRMPACFATPDSPAPVGETRFRGFLGAGAMFDGKQGIRFGDVTDGTANTVLIVSARDPATWTWPEGLTFPPQWPLPRLNQVDPGGCLIGMTNGDVFSITPPTEPLLRAMISRNGGEVISRPVPYDAAAAKQQMAHNTPFLVKSSPSGPILLPIAGGETVVTTPGMTTITARMTPPTVEQRLQRLEEKLDRLIERLDAGGKP